MANENELKVVDIFSGLNITADSISAGRYLSGDDCENISDAINLIKSQQSRIEFLESAIREFLNADDELIVGCADIQNLRNLLEQ